MYTVVKCLALVYRKPTILLDSINCARILFGKRDICTSTWFCADKNNTKSRVDSNWGSKKAHRKIKLNLFTNMADPKIEVILSPLRFLVKEQVNNTILM